MDTDVKAVNCIKKSALQTRLFASLCAATGEEHNTLLYHSEVRCFPVEQYWHASLNYAQLSVTFYWTRGAQSWLRLSVIEFGWLKTVTHTKQCACSDASPKTLNLCFLSNRPFSKHFWSYSSYRFKSVWVGTRGWSAYLNINCSLIRSLSWSNSYLKRCGEHIIPQTPFFTTHLFLINHPSKNRKPFAAIDLGLGFNSPMEERGHGRLQKVRELRQF